MYMGAPRVLGAFLLVERSVKAVLQVQRTVIVRYSINDNF